MDLEKELKKLKVCDFEELPGPKSKEELDEMKMPFEEYCRKVFDPGNEFLKPEALKGIRWMSCTMYIFTPHTVANMAELGAECIKIEMPRMGDAMRHTSPFNEAYLYPLHESRPMTGTGFGYVSANVNKYFISLDYHVPESKRIFYDLVKMSDGLTECYRHGTFDRWKQGYRHVAEMNPRFIYVWGGGFGYGPKIFGGSYDILGQAHAGLASITGAHEDFGGHATKCTNWAIDWYSGTQITVAIMAALNWRLKTGLGTMIEFSQVQAATRCCGYAAPLYGRFGIVRQRWGNWDTQLCVHGIIKCGRPSYPNSENPQEAEEGYIMISAYSDPDFARLCHTIGDSSLAAKYAKADVRIKAQSQMEIYPVLEKWAADKTKEQVAQILDAANIINQPVWNSKEVANQPHFQQRGAVRWLDDPMYGDLLHQGPSYHMSHTPPRLKWALKPVGADNEYVLGKLAGLSSEEIKRLEESECI